VVGTGYGGDVWCVTGVGGPGKGVVFRCHIADIAL
jgi:hypothetical protein